MSRFSRLAVLLAAAALLVAAAPAAAPASDERPHRDGRQGLLGRRLASYGTTYVLWIRARNVELPQGARARARVPRLPRTGTRGRCPNLGCVELPARTASVGRRLVLQHRPSARTRQEGRASTATRSGHLAALRSTSPKSCSRASSTVIRGQLGALAVQVDAVGLADDPVLAVDLHRVAVLAAGREELDHVEEPHVHAVGLGGHARSPRSRRARPPGGRRRAASAASASRRAPRRPGGRCPSSAARAWRRRRPSPRRSTGRSRRPAPASGSPRSRR